jgi:multidrug efflux pump subunit AcrB
MVRFPESERKSIGNLEDMYIRTPDGSEVPFYSVARFELGRGFSSIRRVDGHRVVNVIADVDRSKVSPEEVNASIQREVLPGLMQRYRGLDIGLSGEQEERMKAMTGLAFAALLALVIIYTLLAIPLRSYLQPLVIMSVIPFGAVGAIFGHWVMGELLVFFSMLGIVALSGVVVNSSLVLVDYINRQRRQGVDLTDAVLNAGTVRFRPIMLTSVTTFVGLIPLMASASPATAFVIPMAVSLAFGVLFATFITLMLVPALYTIVEDWFGWDPVAQGMAEPGQALTADNPPGVV